MNLITTGIIAGAVSAKLAYLDPGSGSYLIQILIAALLGSAFVVKSFWNQIKNFFTGLFGGKKEESKDEQLK
ncbi:MAG: hypothetical protein C0391_02330 [Anaerolinea sp.]|nr:hypothetical protein [Anaerolinea sp.]